MMRLRTTIGPVLICALAISALAAQDASAEGNGQTIFECSTSAATREFSDAHCDNTGGSTFGHVQFPESTTAITLTNGATKNSTTEATTAVFKIASLHGFSKVVVECSNVEATGTARNSTLDFVMKGSGSGTIKFNDGIGSFCRTNQAGCEIGNSAQGASISLILFEFETVEGLTLREGGVPGGHGLKIQLPGSIRFEGICGLHSFGAIPLAGSSIATAGGTRQGRGATTWFNEGEMNSLTVGGQSAQLVGKVTLKRDIPGNALTLTTS